MHKNSRDRLRLGRSLFLLKGAIYFSRSRTKFCFASDERRGWWEPELMSTVFLVNCSEVLAPVFLEIGTPQRCPVFYLIHLGQKKNFFSHSAAWRTLLSSGLNLCIDSPFRFIEEFKVKGGRDSNHFPQNTGLGLSFQLPDTERVPFLYIEDTEISNTQTLPYKNSLSSGEWDV